MVVVGRLVGTFEPALLMVTMAHANSASASTNTIAPTERAGTFAGRNGKGRSQSSASPAITARPHASGGRTMTPEVSAASSMAGYEPELLVQVHPQTIIKAVKRAGRSR